MAENKFFRILNKGLIAGAGAAFLSFIIPIVPCTKSSVIANPDLKWRLCRIPNPFKGQLVGIIQNFYNISSEPLAGFLLQFVLVFLIFVLVFLIIRKKAGKILDLTNKKKK